MGIILVAAFVLYVVYSLSTIKDQLKNISEQLNVKDKETTENHISNEEIEKELEDELLK